MRLFPLPMVALVLLANCTQADPYLDNTDVIFACNFTDFEQSQFWATINGADGTDYRFGGATFQIEDEVLQGNATLWPDRAEFIDDSGHPVLRYDHTSGAAVLQTSKTATIHNGTCKVRN